MYSGGTASAMSMYDVLVDAAARIVWIRCECDTWTREVALEDLELDVCGWLDRYAERRQ